MIWEELTGPEFAAAVETCGHVCVLPIGVIEKHGDHLPVGQDTIQVRATALAAAELEPMMVFPFYYFGQNTHAKCEPGAIAIRFDLLHQLLESVCDEICRNGFDKIVIYHGHGGNSNMLNYFCDRLLDAEKPYSLFVTECYTHGGKFGEAKVDGHGGEMETSAMSVIRPDLVKSMVAADYGLPLEREAEFRKLGVKTPTSWYASHPRMLCADQTVATQEKGRRILAEEAEVLAELVRLIKRDDTPARLYREFHARCRKPLEPYTGN